MQYKWTVLSNTTLGTLMSSLDTNIVLIALPTIARNLPNTTVLDLLWILMGYILITATVLVNFGRLSDMFGRVRLYTFGFAVFTVGSALCSLAATGPELIGFRLVQGIGAAFLYSNSGAIITDAFPENERGQALGINQVAIVAGSVLGLVLGGFLTYSIGWRSIFYVNIPIGIVATLWAHHNLKELANIKKGQKVDVWGNVTFAVGIASILTGITLYATSTFSSFIIVLIVIFGSALLVCFLFIEKSVNDPMFNLKLFRIRLFLAGNVAILLNALARGAITFVLVFYLQGPTMMLNPLSAGLFLVPITASLSFFGPISGRLSDRHGVRLFATTGLIVSAIGLLMLTRIGRTVTFEEVLIPLVIIGSGMGMFASPNRASIMNAAPPQERGIASGISTTLTNVGRTFSLGFSFLIMSAVVPVSDLDKIFLGSGSGLTVGPWVNNFISSIHLIFYISAAFLIVAIIPSMLRGAPMKIHDPPKETILKVRSK